METPGLDEASMPPAKLPSVALQGGGIQIGGVLQHDPGGEAAHEHGGGTIVGALEIQDRAAGRDCAFGDLGSVALRRLRRPARCGDFARWRQRFWRRRLGVGLGSSGCGGALRFASGLTALASAWATWRLAAGFGVAVLASGLASRLGRRLKLLGGVGDGGSLGLADAGT